MTTAATPASATPGRLHELDALRGIAALGVVAWHYRWHFGAMPFATLLHPFYNAGFLFVDFFFVLSGLVIARAYWREPRQWRFVANVQARIARLYPLHLLMLLVSALLIASLPAGSDPQFARANDDAKHFALNLLMLNQSGLQDDWSFNTPAWSISAEFIVNVVFLAAIALRVRARLAWGAIAAAIGIALLLAWPRPIISGQYAFGVFDVNLLRCFLAFGAGVGVQYWLDRLGGRDWLARWPRITPWLAAGALLLLFAILSLSHRQPPISHYIASILASAACVAFVPFGGWVKRVLQARPLTFLGDASYSIYLVHYPLQLALYAAAVHGIVRWDYTSPLVFIGFIALVVAVSALTYRGVELPCQRWLLDRTQASRRPASPQP